LFSRRAKNAAADMIRSRIATSEPTGLEPLLRGPTFADRKGADVPLYTDFVHRLRFLSAFEKT